MNYKLGICFMFLGQALYASPSQKINITHQLFTVEKCLKEIKKQTGYSIVYLDDTFDKNRIVKEKIDNISLNEAMDLIFPDKEITYTLSNNTLVLSKSHSIVSQQERRIVLLVQSTTGQSIAGATVYAHAGRQALGQTNSEGIFEGIIGNDAKSLIVKHINFQDHTVELSKSNRYKVLLKEKVNELDETVITGIFERKRESFTGSSTTFTQKELKMVGNTNIFQMLRTLDPSFQITDNNIAGSDPNVLPDLNIRGKTSVIGLREQFTADPNQPLFILDGFESNLQTIFDLSIDRIESVTLLKDASATAIYGSKAANGVVVVETIKPKMGQVRLSYNGNFNFSFADLTDYNLMNSEEKLQFEKLSGYYGKLNEQGEIINESEGSKYNARLAEIRRGVDSYWPNEPLRKTISDRHNIFADGGDERIRYGIGFNYGDTRGVMKGSDRNVIGGNIRLTYRLKNLSVTNYFTVDYTKGKNNVVPFSDFANMNPYYRKYDSNGDILKIVETFPNSLTSNINLYNPMYDYYLKSFDHSASTALRNNLEADMRLMQNFRIRGRFSYEKNNQRTNKFISPLASMFESSAVENKGTYNEAHGNGNNFDFDFSATYGQPFGTKIQHIINAVIGTRANKSLNESVGYSLSGYRGEEFWTPNFSNGFVGGTKPSYSFNDRRSLSYYSNVGYSLNNIYLVDANFRIDGSSIFGLSNKYTKTWAVGLGWNVHNEPFFKNLRDYITFFKLRTSIGNPGNQNFDAYMAMNTYTYNLTFNNPFGLSAIITDWGNPHLKWQKTLDRNYGLDFEIVDRKLRFTFDYFYKTTDPLLIYIQIPSSAGTSTNVQNFGAQLTTGMTAAVNYNILRKEDLLWATNFNLRKINSEYRKIGNALQQLNSSSTSRNLLRYYDGASTTDLWAVKSLGIDPASGREVFEKLDGTQTFVHDYTDERVMGNTTPDYEGVIGSSVFYKGFSAAVNFRYRLGGQIFMNTLYDKVENISRDKLRYNQDKRALYERWQKAGDVSQFKAISLTQTTPISSRFVMDENTFACESVSFGYETFDSWVKKMKLSSLTARFYMNEIFRISSVRNERGINYPFARSISFSIGARF